MTYQTQEERIHTKIKKSVYILQDKDVVFILGIEKEFIGFKKTNQNGILSMYNIRYDLELGIGKDVVRKIPCAYSFCIDRLDLSWDKNEKVTNQNRHSTNKKCLN